jgi:hypothetical protein
VLLGAVDVTITDIARHGVARGSVILMASAGANGSTATSFSLRP